MNRGASSLAVLLLGLGGMVLGLYCARGDYFPVYWGPGLGLTLAVAGAVVCTLALGRGATVVQRGVWTLGAGAVILLVDSALRMLEAHFQPSLGALCVPVAALGRLLGNDVIASDGCVVLQNHSGSFRCAPLLSFLGLRSLGSLVAASIWCEVTLAVRGLAASVFLLGLLCFTGAWLIAIVGYAHCPKSYSGGSEAHLLWFWSPLSLAAALSLTCVGSGAGKVLVTTTLRPSSGASAVQGVVLGLTAGWWLAWDDFGSAKLGRVMVDERFGGAWEPAGRLLDESRYGDFSTYSLSSAVEFLSHRYPVRVNAETPYTRESLEGVDVLVLVTPQVEIPEAEVVAIREWVRSGGGLFVVGDHTDLLGMNTRLNHLLEGTGLRFNNDSLQEGLEGTFNYWKPPLLDLHPIEYGLGEMELMTPCSVSTGWRARPLIQLTQALSARGDYSRNSNFGGRCAGPDSEQGLLNAGGCCRFGAGRIVAFGDSTVFSSFAFYRYQHRQFFERCVAWLNQRRGNEVWAIVPIVGALVFGLLTAIRRKRGGPNAGWVACSFLGAVSVGMISMDQAEGRALHIPSDPGAVCVGILTGNAGLPAVLGRQPDLDDGENLMTWAQVPQRLGYETLDVVSPGEVDDCDVLLLLNPEPDAEDLLGGRTFGEWVARGGRAVLVGKSRHRGHPEDGIPDLVDGLDLHPVGGFEGLDVEVSHARVGDGAVCVIYGSEELDTDSIGHCMAVPTERQRSLYAMGYAAFGRLIGLGPLERRTYVPR